MPQSPDAIGPFRVIRLIASGGMAEVYEVEEPGTGERFALKLLVQVEPALRRFDREYEAMTRLNHPGIARVFHYGNHQGHPWMTMEMVRGTPAQNHVKRFGPPHAPARVAEVVRVVWHLSLALGYVHDRGLIHRDVKSANVLVLPDDRVKVIDFGTAYVVDALERITQDDEFVGTFGYAAPEQIRGDLVDRRTDLYAMGVLLYRLLSGKRPFDDEDPKRLAYKVLHHDPKPITELVPGLDLGLADIVGRLLKKDAADRPQSATAVARALERVSGGTLTTRSRIAVHVPEGITRAAERAAVWRALDAEGPGAMVWLEGAEGAEATRLAETLVTEAADRGRQAWGVAFEGHDGVATLLDLAGVVSNTLDRDEEEALGDRLRAASSPESLVADPDRAQLAMALADVLAAAGRRSRAAIVLSRVERAGLDARMLLQRLAGSLADREAPIGIIGLIEGSLAAMPELAALDQSTSVLLKPLGPREVAVVVGTMLGRRPPGATVARALHAATGGRSEWVEEAVGDLVRRGAVEADGELVAWAEAHVEVPVPPRLVGEVAPRLARTPASERRLLEVLAVLREPARSDRVGAAVGWPAAAVDLVLGNALQRGTVRVTADGGGRSWVLRDAATEIAVQDGLTARRRAAFWSRARAVAEAGPATPGVVRWLAGASLPAEAVKSGLVAADAAVARSAWRTAAEALEPAVAVVEESDARRGAAVTMLASALTAISPSAAGATKALSRAREASAAADGAIRARADLAFAQLHAGIGHYKNHRKLVREAWTRVEAAAQQGALRSRLALEIGRGHHRLGEVGHAEQWYRRSSEEGEHAGDRRAVARAEVAIAALDVARGRFEAAGTAAGRVIASAERAGDESLTLDALAVWCDVLRRQARFSEALRNLAVHLPGASQSEHVASWARLMLVAARCEIDLGRLGSAQADMDEVAASLEKGQHLDLRLEAELVAGTILVASGQDRDAHWRLDQVHQKARSAELVVVADQARALQAEALWNLGDRDSARRAFQAAVLGLLSTGDLAALADACSAWARVSASEVDPASAFRPVQKLLADAPPPLVAMEHRMALVEAALRKGDNRSARSSAQEAARILGRVAERLDETDRAALRVHPIARRLRLALR